MSFLDRLRGRRGPPVPLTLYTRAGCHLCEVMKADVARALAGRRWELCEVDVDGDRALKKAYGLRVPVLSIAGRVAFEGRLEAAALEQEFERREAEWVRAQTLARALARRGEGRA